MSEHNVIECVVTSCCHALQANNVLTTERVDNAITNTTDIKVYYTQPASVPSDILLGGPPRSSNNNVIQPGEEVIEIKKKRYPDSSHPGQFPSRTFAILSINLEWMSNVIHLEPTPINKITRIQNMFQSVSTSRNKVLTT